MKVCITNKYRSWADSETGKGKFVQRLIPELQRLGIEVVLDPSIPVDIDMQLSKMEYWPENAKKRVIRKGPVHYDTNMDYEGHNKEERKYVKQCHGIIYQSEFSKKLNDAFVYAPKDSQKQAVIFNGCAVGWNGKETVKQKHSHNFIASTREWVWEKRLDCIIESFVMADVKDSCLWVAGTVWDTQKRFPFYQKDFQKRYKKHNIGFMGQQDTDKLGMLFNACNAMLFLSYIDACPNSVAESITAGCPVIMGNVGGQVEMVKEGMASKVLALDKEWDFKPTDRRKQPKIDTELVAKAIREYAANPKRESPKNVGHLDIKTIAVQYYNFFERVLA